MKRAVMLWLALAVVLTMSGFAGETNKGKSDGKEMKISGIVTDPMCAKSGDKAKMADADCTKKCAADGKYALVNDKDGSVWAIQNPEKVKGHEGHHVTVNAHVYADKKEVHIMTVKMMADKGAKKEKKS